MDLAALAQAFTVVFLRLASSLLAPLLFGLIVSSLGRQSRERSGELGRTTFWAIVYFEIVTGVAMLGGWAAMVFLAPGAGLKVQSTGTVAGEFRLSELLLAVAPDSAMRAMAENNVLAMIVFFSLLGLAARGELGAALVGFADSVYAVTQQYAHVVMKLAIPGMIAALSYGLLTAGWPMLESMGRFVLACLLVQVLIATLFYPLIILGAGLPLWHLARCCRESALLALTTSSTVVALPKAIEAMERFGIPRSLLGLVMPLGLSFNLTGSSTQLMMSSLLAAQAVGKPLNLQQAMLLLLVLKIAGKGVAGIPRANLVVLSAVFPVFGLPLEIIPLLLAVDGLIDPLRTMVNVLGNCLAPAVLARWLAVEEARPAR